MMLVFNYDEPMSSLSQKETETLFDVVGFTLKRYMLFIFHRLGESSEPSDRVTVFRDGENAGDLAKDEITHDNMVRLMVGRELSEFYDRDIHQVGECVLKAIMLFHRPILIHQFLLKGVQKS